MEQVGNSDGSYPQLTADGIRSIEGFEHSNEAEMAKLLHFFTKVSHLFQHRGERYEENEKKVLNFLRSGEYDKVVIEFKDSRMHSLILNKVQQVKKKIVDVLKENPFQKITIKSHRGKVVRVETSTKIKLD